MYFCSSIRFNLIKRSFNILFCFTFTLIFLLILFVFNFFVVVLLPFVLPSFIVVFSLSFYFFILFIFMRQCSATMHIVVSNVHWIIVIRMENVLFRCVTRGGEGGGLPCPFLKIKKSALILEKNALIVCILRLNLPFKMQF